MDLLQEAGIGKAMSLLEVLLVIDILHFVLLALRLVITSALLQAFFRRQMAGPSIPRAAWAIRWLL